MNTPRRNSWERAHHMQQGISTSEIIIYTGDGGRPALSVRIDGETVWLTQTQLAKLFQTTKQNISQHIKNIFEEAELSQKSVVKNFFTTASDGKNYRVNHYNLELIISVGYRVKSSVAKLVVGGLFLVVT